MWWKSKPKPVVEQVVVKQEYVYLVCYYNGTSFSAYAVSTAELAITFANQVKEKHKYTNVTVSKAMVHREFVNGTDYKF